MAEPLFGGLRAGQVPGLREEFPDLESQKWLAPLEHQGYAYEVASENPLLGLGLIGGIPAYQAAKALRLMGSRTGASQPIEQMAAGYKGLGQGWANALAKALRSQ